MSGDVFVAERLMTIAASMRRSSVRAIHKSGGGHFGGTLSAIDIVAVLLDRLGWSPTDPREHKIVLSKGHGAMALYAGLAAFGKMPPELLNRFGKSPSDLQGHPDISTPVPLTFSTGSLGQGLSAALGMALLLKTAGRTACAIIGDGECQEGQIWEAAMVAHRLNISNLVVIIDANDHQEWGYRSKGGQATKPILAMEQKWAAFGWSVHTCDGHDHLSLANELDRAIASTSPAVIIARTRKGYGSPFLENNPDRFHCSDLKDEEFAKVMEELLL